MANKIKISQMLSNLTWSVKNVFNYNRVYFACLCINSVLDGFVPVVTLIIIQRVIDAIQYHTDNIQNIIKLIVILTIFELVSQLLQIFTQLKIENYELEFDSYFHEKILRKISLLDCKDFENSKTYNLINRTQYDANVGILGSIKIIFSLISTAISSISYIIIIFKYSIVIFLIVIILPIVRYFFEKRYNIIEYDIEKNNTELSRRSSYISYLLTNSEHFKEIKIFHLFNFFIDRYQRIRKQCNNDLIKVHNKRALSNGILYILEAFIDFIITLSILLKAFNNIISIGAFVLYSNSIDNLKSNIVSLFSQISYLYKNSAMIEQIREFFDMDNENIQEDGIVIENIKSIELIGVSYKYYRQTEYALNNINIKIEAGETLVFMGYNGSGKSTLMKIIMGIYNDYEGEIFVNGINRKKLNLKSYRDRVSVLFQDYIKYETNIYENISYGNLTNTSEELIDETMKKVCLQNLKNLKNQQLGYQFNEGLQLSVGQWQKIALGRSIIGTSDLYIFDEPNSSIDLKSESIMLNTIINDSNDKIKLFIIHRFNKIVEKAELIITLRDGKIMEKGSHQQLIHNKGLYYELYSLQNEIIKP